MDKKLIYSDTIFNKIKEDFESIEIEKLQFEIWTELPNEYLNSYYENEKKIEPNKLEFEEWSENITSRPEPIYSVAIFENKIVSSIYSGNVYGERNLNLWHTNNRFRRQQIGKGVLLNLLKTIFEKNNKSIIKAWDITSEGVDNILTTYGFE
ncbi:hypothetical protein [Aquimarina algiphila]|uniref:GNAT family N-acetyltransferase n=1 Tax=Aquimarina algiphila TaxID=2047982 RepID=A0A554VEQ5_9FLAO|nr:hypothetical protein [Aquimarina algiphila]TSE05587.1 hypothetical protein FOF46_22330 [Aquimarina algiphila]